MRRALLCLVALLPLLAGCWDQQAIEQLGFVAMVLVDGVPGSLHVTYRVVVPSQLPSSTNPGSPNSTTVVAGSGRDLAQATRQANLASSKRLYMGQIQAVLLSERFARAGGAAGAMDFFVRGTRTRNISWVLVVPDDQIQAVMSLAPANAAYPAEAITDMDLNQREQGEVPSIRIFQFINQIVGAGRDAAAPLLRAGRRSYRFAGVALFRQGRLVANLSPQQAEDFALLVRRSRQPSVAIPCNKTGTISAELQNPHRQLSALVHQGRLTTLKVRLRAVLHVDEATLCPINFTDRGQERAMRTAAAGIVMRRMEAALGRLQRVRSDPLGFGEVVRATDPTVWDAVQSDWHEVFARLPIRVEVQLTPDDSGLLNGTV